MIQILKGMKDVLPSESHKWQCIETIIRQLCKKHGFSEVRTPVLEHTELFLRGVGNTTDIVQKEMYTFNDKGDRSVTLKPEGTAGVVRMFIENGMDNEVLPQKMFYLNAPIFRYERPQAGRLREHHQFGVEVFGGGLPSADAEVIALSLELLTLIGVSELSVNINSIGCKCCRPKYNEGLKKYFSEHKTELCELCNTRLEQNPLRILDCKNEKCQEICKDAPRTTDNLCDDCSHHFSKLQEYLSLLGVNYKVDSSIVRGLDYYTKTVFEVVSDSIGAKSAILGGGRYDNLVEQLGGKPTPAVGFGMGLERVILMLDNMGITLSEKAVPDVYIAAMGEEAEKFAFTLTRGLRDKGITAEFDHVGKSFKAQMKYADKIGAKTVICIGENEMTSHEFTIKRLCDGAVVSANERDIPRGIQELCE